MQNPYSEIEKYDALFQSKTLRYSLYGSFFSHLLIILISFLEPILATPDKKIVLPTKKLMVSTVSLQPQMATSSSLKMESPTTQIAEIETPRPSIEPEIIPIEKEDSNSTPTVEKTIQPIESPKKKETEKSKQSTPDTKPKKKKEAEKKPEPKKVDSKKTDSNTSAAKKVDSKKINQKNQNPQVDTKLLKDAIAYLDSSSKSTKTGSSKTPSNNQTNATSSSVKAIGTLLSESDEFLATTQNGVGNQEASVEAWYISDLIRRLQLNLRLQEPGVVKIHLSINSEGQFLRVSIIECSSQAVKKELEKNLSKIKYAPFGNAFKKEKEHLFRLKLEDDGIWSF